MIYACQARLVSDIEVVTQPVPDPVAVSARVANLTRLAPDVIGVDVEVPKALDYLAGQYAMCGFAVFPHGAAAPPIR